MIHRYELVKERQIDFSNYDYKSSISYYSELVGNTFAHENAVRLKMKVFSKRRNNKWEDLMRYFLS